MKKFLLTTAAAMAATCAYAQKPITPPAGGKQISDELIGIFFEDISMSADGGLNAELVQNGSFEYNPNEQNGWGPGTAWTIQRPGHSLGYVEIRMDKPIHENNPTYMRLNVERVGHYYDYNGWTGFGLANNGFDGINVKEGEKYDFSVFMRNVGDNKGKKVRIVLSAPVAPRDPSVHGQQGAGRPMFRMPEAIAEAEITVNEDRWSKYEAVLTPSRDCPNATLQILVLNTGSVDIDMISLMPEDTYMGHGIRKDLAQALADLKPKFMRFVGGCVVHGGGDGFWDTYRWKTTVGPKETRRGIKNTWGYHQSMNLGYYEYFQFCEDLGMEPLPILPCGVSCQGANGGWSMKDQAQDWVPMDEMDEWVDEALDLIEWANGSADTKWGKVRAEAGHPEPFNLKYLGIGNEERISPEFEERFEYMYEKITAAHPEIVIIGTCGPGSHPGERDYESAWKFADKLQLPIMDEHYYEPRTFFQEKRQYDSYDRSRTTKVYLGEYAAKDKKMADALAEALYLLHVERNGDVVVMTSYAPLFARKGTNNWNPNLIYFDNDRPYLTCSYYVQQMFGHSAGQYFYGDCVTIQDKTNLQEQSVVLNVKDRELYVKVCNASADSKRIDIDLSRFKGIKEAVVTTLHGEPDQENNFDSQPVAPVTETVRMTAKTSVDLEPYTFRMYTIKL